MSNLQFGRLGLETFELAIPTLPPAVLINDPINLEYVLKNNDLFVKGKFFHSNSWDLFGIVSKTIMLELLTNVPS